MRNLHQQAFVSPLVKAEICRDPALFMRIVVPSSTNLRILRRQPEDGLLNAGGNLFHRIHAGDRRMSYIEILQVSTFPQRVPTPLPKFYALTRSNVIHNITTVSILQYPVPFP